MGKLKILTIICLALAATTLFWGVDPGRAQAEETKQPQAVTGPFRDAESVPKHRSTTNAQREEAARLAAEYRAEVARGVMLKNTTTPGTASPNSTVPPKAKGGTNE